MIFKFGMNLLDEPTRVLLRNGQSVAIAPKVFDVLVYLIRNRDRVVSRDELLERFWPSEFVSDSAVSKCIQRARYAIGDADGAMRAIQTSHSRGFRFVATVEGINRLNGPEDALRCIACGAVAGGVADAPSPPPTEASPPSGALTKWRMATRTKRVRSGSLGAPDQYR